MKNIVPVLLLAVCSGACQNKEKSLVDPIYVDSFITHYTPPAGISANEQELRFWKGRINPHLPGYLNESRYAGTLNMAFRLTGVIDSLRKADSILQKVDQDFNHKEASPNMTLATHCITEHRFMDADSFLLKARQLGVRPYESASVGFDVDFELGRYTQAKTELNALRSPNDFGYFFRQSKMDHLNGELDSAIRDMQRAAELAGSNGYLKGVALSNAGDLYIHAGDLRHARDVYVQCIRLNSADFHSWMGLGWIALVHDGNDSLAEKIFRWVAGKNPLPYPLFKLAQTAGARKDTASQLRWAGDFEKLAENRVYGRMYNKYLLELYTGILQKPAQAEALAKDELRNRATPQTYAWYAWALFSNNKKDQAYDVFRLNVSGQPLEGLELYWMGRLMQGLNKNYNAGEFFRAAAKTAFDLDPADALYVQNALKE